MLSRRAFLGRAATGAAVVIGGSTVLAEVLEAAAKPVAITVYKSPTCGCCQKWIDHASKDATAFRVVAQNVTGMEAVKQQLGVPEALWSCHTAVVGGYAFEGHVPWDLVKKVVRERPKIAGLAVPGMPAGSPGMEVGSAKEPYDVVAWTRQGKTSVYAKR